jgi:methionyl-tRNA formyltransferase
MKLIFMGTPEFGAIILEGLIKGNFKPYLGRRPNGPFRPILVITAPDKPVGRKQIFTPPPVKVIAQKYNIPILQPEKIQEAIAEIRATSPGLVAVAAYGQILPQEILDIPKYGCLNVHPSLLPKYRGPSPIQYAILNGDEETGITMFLMDAQIDHGPIIAKSKLKNQISKMTYPELSKELAKLGAELLIRVIPDWISGEIKLQRQDEKKATYTKILKKEDGKIDWKKSAEEIERQIRAFESWPGTYAELRIKNQESRMIKILKSSVLEQNKIGRKGPVGKTFLAPDDKIAVQTEEDYLLIEELQPEGKRKMTSEEFLRGHPDFIGKILK